ncbi:MAG: hypothetical protein Q4F49_04890 [Pseudoxanthomonas suwonensis]|nr:hypothetical protein [Pseudoxanthomonas suwonensis]
MRSVSSLLLPLVLLLAFGAAPACAQAQTRDGGAANTAVLPIWNNASGRLEAYLVLEPASGQQPGARWRFGNNSLDAAFGLRRGDSLALLCDRKSGIVGSIGNLANNCLLASLDGEDGHRQAAASVGRGANRVGVALGEGRSTLPAWLTPGATARADVNDLTVFAQRNVGSQGFVSIAGTVARARLMSPADARASGLASDQWTTRNLSVGGGFGNFGANVVGHVVDTPGQPKWEGLGLGLTWRTPWSGQLSVGADNIVTRGRNPFSASRQGEDEGATPYIRYEQGL